jgi:hypothetical protein
MSRRTNGAVEVAAERNDRLMAVHQPTRYTAAEQRFSGLLQKRLDELLRGERNGLILFRKYPDEPGRLGIMATPDDLDPRGLRIPVVEQMIRDALLFLHADPHGGPTSQRANGDGLLVETQKFTTKFPHIVIERTDVYDAASERPIHIHWSASRVQNQRAATRINRMLDAANLGLDVVKIFF